MEENEARRVAAPRRTRPRPSPPSRWSRSRIGTAGRHAMKARRALMALLVVVVVGGASVRAGVQDTPLPTFSNGQAAQLAALIRGAIKDNNVETVVICTNLTLAPLDVGLEVFDETGSLRNSIAAGDAAFFPVAAGVTVTVGTGPVAALHE